MKQECPTGKPLPSGRGAVTPEALMARRIALDGIEYLASRGDRESLLIVANELIRRIAPQSGSVPARIRIVGENQ